MLLDEYVENRRALELLKERDRASFLLAPSQLTQMAAAGKLDPRRVQVLSEIWNRTQDQNKLLTALNTLGYAGGFVEDYYAKAEERRHNELSPTVIPETLATQPQARPTQPRRLTPREQKILAVIRPGVTGRLYARELDHASLKPRRSWTDRGCPSTYLAAFDDPSDKYHWRQMIQDEKTKIARKRLKN